MSTLPGVTVANSTTGGQPTLTITAGGPLFGDGSDQVLTVNARTGIPISSVESGGGLPTAVETNLVSRVTLADIEAGKFWPRLAGIHFEYLGISACAGRRHTSRYRPIQGRSGAVFGATRPVS